MIWVVGHITQKVQVNINKHAKELNVFPEKKVVTVVPAWSGWRYSYVVTECGRISQQLLISKAIGRPSPRRFPDTMIPIKITNSRVNKVCQHPAINTTWVLSGTPPCLYAKFALCNPDQASFINLLIFNPSSLPYLFPSLGYQHTMQETRRYGANYFEMLQKESRAFEGQTVSDHLTNQFCQSNS